MLFKNIYRAAPFVVALIFANSCTDYRDYPNTAIDTVPAYDRFVGSIYFRTASSNLSIVADKDLKRIARILLDRRYDATTVVIRGLADRERGVEENIELASERAQRVALSLEKYGIPLERITIDSRPSYKTRAVASNRRVDIYMGYGSKAAYRTDTLYPILVGFFLLITFAVAVVVFRRQSR
ncbi:MAG: hypothetical protein LDLANPLL_00179 [Turneriella sp.]|nr:hypothetical protein [Turneriella sp.]